MSILNRRTTLQQNWKPGIEAGPVHYWEMTFSIWHSVNSNETLGNLVTDLLEWLNHDVAVDACYVNKGRAVFFVLHFTDVHDYDALIAFVHQWIKKRGGAII
jgi:hypothetical protein